MPGVQKTPFCALKPSGKPLAAPGDHPDHLMPTWHHQIARGTPWEPYEAIKLAKNAACFESEWPKFKFPALFSPVPLPIGPVPEINLPDHDPDHHQKFGRNRARHLGLVRPATDRLLLYRGCSP